MESWQHPQGGNHETRHSELGLEAVRPVQFFAPGLVSDSRPELRLALAVLEQAIVDVDLYRLTRVVAPPPWWRSWATSDEAQAHRRAEYVARRAGRARYRQGEGLPDDVKHTRPLKRPRVGRSPALYWSEDALDWFRSRDRSWPFSFENVCELLGLSASTLRAALFRRWLAVVDKQTPPQQSAGESLGWAQRDIRGTRTRVVKPPPRITRKNRT